MRTKVFISWSGDRSRQIAEVFREWIPSVLQMTDVYFTPNDIQKGTRWSTEIATELNGSQIGIFILTRENLNSPWMMFEAGAISKSLDAAFVAPILFNLETSDVSGPLTQFQMSRFEKPEMLKLLKTINGAAGSDKLTEKTIENVFDKWWDELQQKVLAVVKNDDANSKQVRSDREILEEILGISRVLGESAASTPNKPMLGRNYSSFVMRMRNDSIKLFRLAESVKTEGGIKEKNFVAIVSNISAKLFNDLDKLLTRMDEERGAHHFIYEHKPADPREPSDSDSL